MLALKNIQSESKLKQVAKETLTFQESLAGQLLDARLVNAETMGQIEIFARENLDPRVQYPPLLQTLKPERKYGPNERISVRYTDGSVKRDIKFKKVKSDLAEKRCTLIEN